LNVAELRHTECEAIDVGALERYARLSERAIRVEPHRAAPWMVKAQAHALEGHTEQALQSIDRAISIDPSDPDKFELKASFLSRAGRANEAATCSREARRLRTMP
jgi:Flp pilus assembly protein TadD